MRRLNNKLIKRIMMCLKGKEIWNAKMSEDLTIQVIKKGSKNNYIDDKEGDKMGGHVLWTEGDVIRVLQRLFQTAGNDVTYSEYIEILQPLLRQAAYKEQIWIIHRLIESGISEEECAFRLSCSKERIVEILEFYNSDNEYDFSYMKLKELFSEEGK